MRLPVGSAFAYLWNTRLTPAVGVMVACQLSNCLYSVAVVTSWIQWNVLCGSMKPKEAAAAHVSNRCIQLEVVKSGALHT